MRVFLALALAVLAAAPAASTDTSDAALDRAVAGRVAGTPVDCILRPRTGRFQATDRHLIYRVRPSVTYVTEVSPGCGAYLSRQALVFRSPSSQVCRGDIAEVFDTLSRTSSGSCSLGKFVPYTLP